MTQFQIFMMGITLLVGVVMLMFWLAEPARRSQVYRSRRTGLLIEVRDMQGREVPQEDVVAALQDVLTGNCEPLPQVRDVPVKP